MIKPEKIDNDVVIFLQKRLQDEFNAFYHYRAAQNYCNNVGFFKAAEYFKGESEDELVHAKKLEQYLVDWNVTPILPIIPAPKVSFKGLGEIIEKSYTIEYELYEAYEDNSSKIFKLNELCTFDFLEFFRTTQRTSVAEYSDMLNVLDGVNVDSKFEMLMLEETLFEKEG